MKLSNQKEYLSSMRRAGKRIIAVLFSLSLILPMCMISSNITQAMAAGTQNVENMPAKPKIKATVTSKGNSIKLTIGKTANAEGYYIYAKGEGESAFTKIATLKKSGTASLSYTYSNLSDGEYSLRVKAYANVDGKKVSSKYSSTVVVNVNSPLKSNGIKIVGAPKLYSYGAANFPTEDHPFALDVKVGTRLTDAVLRLEYMDAEGNARPRDVDSAVKVDSTNLAFYVVADNSADLAVFAYASEEDAENQQNPIAISNIVNVGCYPGSGNEAGDTEPDSKPAEEPKYADISFKDGYAYFGVYPQNKVTDSKLIDELNRLQAQNPGSQAKELNGKYYQLATVKQKDAWYESAPVEWIILKGSEKTDTVTLMANRILLSTGFTDYKGYKAADSWKNSFLYYHLNGISGKTFDSIWSFDFMGVLFGNQRDRVLLEQEYDGKSALVLLPTKKQIEKLEASAQIIKASDMTTVAGENGYWLLDSAGSGMQYVVNRSGKITKTETWRQEYGVVPVIKVDLKNCNILP